MENPEISQRSPKRRRWVSCKLLIVMTRFIRAVSVLAGVAAAATSLACDKTPATSPSSTATSTATPAGTAAATTGSWELSGVATGDDGRPVTNARLIINLGIHGAVLGMTDETGRYHVTFDAQRGAFIRGSTAEVTLFGDGYEVDYSWFRPTGSDSHQVLDLHPNLIRWINTGESVSVAVAADDKLCINNAQDMPNYSVQYVCRTVRFIVPADGVLTVEAVSANLPASHPPLEMEGVPEPDCCYFGNPLKLPVVAGMVVKVSVEILEGSPSQTFTLTTTIR
jgi:hypothetical protein